MSATINTATSQASICKYMYTRIRPAHTYSPLKIIFLRFSFKFLKTLNLRETIARWKGVRSASSRVKSFRDSTYRMSTSLQRKYDD